MGRWLNNNKEYKGTCAIYTLFLTGIILLFSSVALASERDPRDMSISPYHRAWKAGNWTNEETWTPPIGIPYPGDWAFKNYRMYSGQLYEAGGFNYRDAGNGPYTHYIDNTKSNCTNTNNNYGTAELPRCNFPTGTLAEGSVVEVHGGNYTGRDDRRDLPVAEIKAEGTAEKPVFVRGYSDNKTMRVIVGSDPTVFRSALRIGYQTQPDKVTSYLIIENLDFRGYVTVSGGSDGIVDHLVFRHNIIRDTYAYRDDNGNSYKATCFSLGGSYTSEKSHHVFFFNNEVGPCGDRYANYDQDSHGFVPGPNNTMWVVDNHIHHTSGDGTQIAHNGGDRNGTIYTNHIYVGGNLNHSNKQAGFGTKYGEDLVYSQNIVYDIEPIEEEDGNASSPGQCFGAQYNHRRIWWLFNEGFDCDHGLIIGDSTGTEMYAIGNVFHDIAHTDFEHWEWQPDGDLRGYAMMIRGGVTVNLLGNTFFNNEGDIAINDSTGGRPGREFYVNNNLIYHSGPMFGLSVNLGDTNNGDGETRENVIARSDATRNVIYNAGGRSDFIRWYDYNTRFTSVDAWLNRYKDKGKGSVSADPMLVDVARNNPRLSDGSPAIDAAALEAAFSRYQELYGLNIRYDFDGNPRTSAWDIGALEFRSGDGGNGGGNNSGGEEKDGWNKQSNVAALTEVGVDPKICDTTQKHVNQLTDKQTQKCLLDLPLDKTEGYINVRKVLQPDFITSGRAQKWIDIWHMKNG